jgi:hypothetical protein
MVLSWHSRLFVLASLLLPAAVPAQDPDKPKGPDKEVAEQIDRLKEVVLDRKMARDGEGVDAIDKLLMKVKEADLDPKDRAAIVKAYEHALTGGKQRPHDKPELYNGAVEALGYLGPDGAKVLSKAYFNKSRFPEKPEWVPLRERMLKNLGRTKDESMVQMLIKEAVRNPEAALNGAAGEALGNFEESKDAVRKDIVGELMTKYGSLDEKASQIGTNIEAQNAQNTLAAIQDKWHSTLSRLTKQNFTTFREWQTWHNKHRNAPW